MKMRFLIPAVFAVATLSAAKAEAQCGNATFGAYTFESCWINAIALGGGNAWNDPSGASMSAFLNTNEPDGAVWSGVEKVDWSGGAGNGGAFDFTGGTSGAGTISFDPDLAAGWFAIAFKQKNAHVIYTFNNEGDAISDLSFDINGVGGDWNGVSNLSLWRGALCEEDCGEFGEVPEPSTFALMFLGLAGLGVAARRRRNV